MNWEEVLLFSTIAFIATITPGPAILLVTSNSLTYGIKKSILTILGNITGLFIMSFLAVLGLTTIILYSAPVFFTVKIIGAVYLIYLGFKLWRFGFNLSVSESGASSNLEVTPKRYRMYIQGIFLSLSNPKAIAFTTALIPQFIHSELPLAPQFLVLVCILMFLSFTSLIGFAFLATKAKQRSSTGKAPAIIGKFFGGAFIGSGLLLAFSSQR